MRLQATNLCDKKIIKLFSLAASSQIEILGVLCECGCVCGVRLWSNLLPTLYGNKAGELGDYGVLSAGVDDVILTLSLDNLNDQVHL